MIERKITDLPPDSLAAIVAEMREMAGAFAEPSLTAEWAERIDALDDRKENPIPKSAAG